MKMVRLVITVFASGLLTICIISGSAAAGKKLWSNMCASCHDGKTAPDVESLMFKYQTVDVFAEAVKSKGHRCMNILKNDEELMKKIGREIGLKETKQ